MNKEPLLLAFHFSKEAKVLKLLEVRMFYGWRKHDFVAEF